uniref:Large ribosomal subunit protein uL23 n=1 Tax=Candidatus Kentrum sp. MB TaxID=2138164 RepID=A0A450XSJ8_9GAMM|nr:MAG: LSU ribosomal protein L23P [Candidatus Kentron sp. MB]VFK32260.1 MAG: LSU ribosomal protein L23P [Candidatus Kentron sp. MB]VFK75777.1 MAG: LSU ribosomal protein L23P [Candidatus Kentron sp. MB]
MKQNRVMEVLQFPHLSEKSERMGNKYHQIVFRIAVDANKFEIKRAVEEIFKLKVKKVCTLNVKGKRKLVKGSHGRRFGHRANWKKAYVMLEGSDDFDFSSIMSVP